MPKWIINSKRRHSKEDDQGQRTLRGGGGRDEGASGRSLSSDSGRSMSPVGSADSDSERHFEDIEGSLDWKGPRSMMDEHQQQQQQQQQQQMSPSSEDDNGPLDLSTNGPLGRKAIALAVVDRCSLNSRESGIQEKARSRPDVPLLVRINRQLPLPMQHSHMEESGRKWSLGSRHLILTSDSFPGERERRKRPQVYTENNGHCEDHGQIPEAHATPEAIAQLERIENKIGDFNCMLCANHYENAFHLANHNCSRIVKVIHRCSECNKVFQCPANLASHRRWHAIRSPNMDQSLPEAPETAAAAQSTCGST